MLILKLHPISHISHSRTIPQAYGTPKADPRSTGMVHKQTASVGNSTPVQHVIYSCVYTECVLLRQLQKLNSNNKLHTKISMEMGMQIVYM